jgi:hypothetical protein
VIGSAVWGEGSAGAQTWVTAQARWLKRTGPDWLLGEVRDLLAGQPESAVLRRELAYLEKRAAQLEYPRFQAGGWPLGSGVIESGNKLVVEARLKGAGMRWARERVNGVLSLRNAVCNDRWAEEWAVLTRVAQTARRVPRAERAPRPRGRGSADRPHPARPRPPPRRSRRAHGRRSRRGPRMRGRVVAPPMGANRGGRRPLIPGSGWGSGGGPRRERASCVAQNPAEHPIHQGAHQSFAREMCRIVVEANRPNFGRVGAGAAGQRVPPRAGRPRQPPTPRSCARFLPLATFLISCLPSTTDLRLRHAQL